MRLEVEVVAMRYVVGSPTCCAGRYCPGARYMYRVEEYFNTNVQTTASVNSLRETQRQHMNDSLRIPSS
jgi:hypothetical protein